MAEAHISVDENHFQCPICLEILKDPVTIPCGHSYCMECIRNCWDEDEGKGVYSCPQCRKTFDPRPVLGRNLILADMVNKLRVQGHQITKSDEGFAGPDDVECTVCIGKKRKAEKSCLECYDSYCEIHLCHHEELHSGKRHKVVEAVSQLQKKLCPEHSKPLEAFCQTDSKCLCVACIVDDKHKGHDVISPATAKENNQVKYQNGSCSNYKIIVNLRANPYFFVPVCPRQQAFTIFCFYFNSASWSGVCRAKSLRDKLS